MWSSMVPHPPPGSYEHPAPSRGFFMLLPLGGASGPPPLSQDLLWWHQGIQGLIACLAPWMSRGYLRLRGRAKDDSTPASGSRLAGTSWTAWWLKMIPSRSRPRVPVVGRESRPRVLLANPFSTVLHTTPGVQPWLVASLARGWHKGRTAALP